jgi:hypothetical protein
MKVSSSSQALLTFWNIFISKRALLSDVFRQIRNEIILHDVFLIVLNKYDFEKRQLFIFN